MMFTGITFMLFLHVILTKGQECTLPSGQKSTCVRVHLCNHFQNIIKQYGGRPPPEVTMSINNYVCANPRGTLCCPDNAEAPSTVAPPPPPVNDLMKQIVNYEALKTHPNINLVNDKRCGQAVSNRIVGGDVAEINEIPWLALLGYKLRLEVDKVAWSCGGALITPRFVVSAAHCLNRDLVKVRLGEHTISTETDCDGWGLCADPIQDIDIEKSIKHPNFDKNIKKNDFALLKLKTAALTNQDNIETICLPIALSNDIEMVHMRNPRVPMTIGGFGRVGNGARDGSDVLMRAFVPYMKKTDCKNRYAPDNIPIHEEYLCAGGHNKTDTCPGDSGGPIYTLGGTSNSRVMLYGVVIGGVDCERKDRIYPGIYSDIRHYLVWILDNIKP